MMMWKPIELAARFKCWWIGHTDWNECKRCGKTFRRENDRVYDLHTNSFIDRHEMLCVLMLIIFIFVVAVYILFFIVSLFAKKTCMEHGLLMDVPAQYNFWVGCSYYVKGQWIPSSMLSYVDLLGLK